jgi:type II secretory pathway component GspD/PulD (secretin)/tetratricopeptide (TPR) repeat protein
MLQPAPAAALAFGDKREPSSLIDRVQRLLVPGYRPSLRLTWRAMLAALVLGSVLLVLSAVGTRMTVAAILTPQQRIEKIEKKMTEYGEKPEVESTTPHSKNAPKVEVSGRVRMADGSALPKIKWVNIYTERKNYGGVSSARPSTNGMFSTTVSSGRICAGVEIPGFAPVVAGPVDATGTNRVENLDLVLDRGFDAPIEITDAETGKPISGAIVKAQFWVREMGVGIGTSRELKTDATGTATMTPCSDSVALTLIVNASGYEIVEQRIEKLKPQEAIRFKLQRGLSRSGVVLNKADNSPLEGATVRMIYERGRKEQRYEWTDEARVLAKTDAAGRFTVNQLQRGTQYWLGVSAPGHESVLVGPVMAGASDLAMQLGPEIIVRGRVIGSLEGLQIINKDYCLSRNYSEVFDDHSNGFQQWLPVRVTDGVATFQFTNPIPGRVTLSDRQGFHQERDVTAPVDDWVVDLTEREKTNAPVVKREVVFRFKHPSAVPPRGTVSVTIPDSLEINHLTAHSVELEITNGEVRAEIAIGGRTSIEAKHMVGYWFNRFGERGSLLSIEVTNGTGPLVIEIPLVPAGAIYAKARNDDGTPAGGLMFGLSELERALGVDKSSLIGGDSDGFSGDAPRKWVSGPLPLGGTYQIYGWRGNMFCMSRPVKLTEANPDAEVELQFPPGKTFDGVVLDADGKPLRDLVLNPEFILAGNHSFALKSVFTDERGCFRIENMTPELGEYSVVVAAPGLMAEIMKPDFGSQPQTIRLQRGRTLAGRVVQAGTGYAVPNAELRAQDFDHNKLPGQTTRTDADGRFEFTTLGDANYTLYVSDGQLSSDKKFRADGNINVTLAVKLYGWSKLKPKPPVTPTADQTFKTGESDSAIASNKVDVTTLVQDGKLLFEMGKLDQAEAKLKKAIAVEPDNQTALHYLDLIKGKRATAKAPASVPIDAGASDLRTVLFKIDTYTGFTNLQKLSGLDETSSLNEQLQKLFFEAGVKPPLTNIVIYKEGTLIVPGTKAQMDLVNKVVQRLNGVSSNDSRTLTNQNPNLAESDTLLQDGKLLFEMGKLDQAEAKLRKALDLDPLNNAAAYYFNLVHEARFKATTTRRSSNAQTMVHTNLIYTSKGRQAIASKLNSIHLDSIVFPEGGLPLSEVIRNLSKVSKDSDPEKRGINFIINSGVESAPAAAPVEGGGGLPPVPAEPLDLGAVIVKLNPGLTDVRLADVLDAITKNAEKPIKYVIEDYAVVFSLKTDADLQRLFGRSFKVDPNVMLSNLGKQTGLTSTNREEETKALVKIFSDAGVDLQPPKGIFYNDRGGVLVVRATKEDLEIVGTVLQALNYSPPQINIKVEFIELSQNGDSVYLGSVSMPVTNSPAGGVTPLNNPTVAFPFNPSGGSPINRNPQTAKLQGILSPAQAKIAIAALKSNPRAVVAAQPEVTTLSGRQAQIQIVDVESILKGINPLALTPPGITVTTNNGPGAYLIEQMSFGPMLDVVAHASADEYTIHLTATLKVTAFLGYDNPGTNTTIYVNGKKQSVVPPLPHFYSDQTTVTNAVIWDGQTLVLGGLIREEVSKVKDKTPILGDLPLVGGMFRHESSNIVRKNLFVFITPTLIDPAGNRLHTDEDMPSAQNGVPVQAK